jgi:hypothetical protein
MNKYAEVLKKYLDIFAGQEMCFINDTRNLELFEKNPSNISADDIRTKVSALKDDSELKQLSGIDDMVNHILSLKIDDRLKRADLSLVEDIANISVNGRAFHFLHFASAYCNLHRPEVYPIYSDQHLDLYRAYIKENNLKLDPDKLTTYVVFSAALNDLIERQGLKGKMNFLHLRKFGWLYTDHVMKESAG